jgi:hypothetical protein
MERESIALLGVLFKVGGSMHGVTRTPPFAV